MTSLHVICGLGPPINNPGYAYDHGTPFIYLFFVVVIIHHIIAIGKRLFLSADVINSSFRATPLTGDGDRTGRKYCLE